MAINFPASPTNGQVFIQPASATIYPASQSVVNGNGPIWVYNNGAWRRNAGTALRTNKIVNPVMQVSQQNGDGSSSGTLAFFTADQWQTMLALQNQTADQWRTTLAGIPHGTKYAIRYQTMETGTPAAADYAGYQHKLEGNRMADLAWGTANAQYAVFRCTVNLTCFAPKLTGLCAVIRNAALDRTFVMDCSIPQALNTTMVEFSFVVPPEKTGVWPTDTAAWGNICFVGVCGTTYRTATPGTWVNANMLCSTTTGMANLNQAGDAFSVTNVGLYADPNMTGVAPEFLGPNIEDDLQDCLRYWYLAKALRGVCTAVTTVRVEMHHPVIMRAGPALSLVAGAAPLRIYDGAAVGTTTSVAILNTTTQHIDANVVASAGALVAGRPGAVLVDGAVANSEPVGIAVSARM